MDTTDPRLLGTLDGKDPALRLDVTSPFRQEMYNAWIHGGPLGRYQPIVDDVLHNDMAESDTHLDKHVVMATVQIEDRIQNHLPIRYIQRNMAELLVYLAVYQREKFESLVTKQDRQRLRFWRCVSCLSFCKSEVFKHER